MENIGGIDGYLRRWIDCSHFNFIFGFIIRCNSFFNIATQLLSWHRPHAWEPVESLFSVATSDTTTSCGTVTVDHFQECFGCRATVQHDWD